MIDILLFYSVVAFVFSCGKQILQYGSPFFLCAFRLIPAGIIFLTGVYIFSKKNFYIHKKDYKSLFYLILFVFFMDVFRFVGLAYVSSSYSALLSTFSPFIAAIISWYFYQEKLGIKKISALVLGFVAIFPLIFSQISQASGSDAWYACIGYLAGTLSTCAVVIRTFFLKDLVDLKRYNSYFILGITFFTSGIISLLLSVLFEEWNPIPCTNILSILPYILFLMIFYNLIAQPLYALLVKKYTISLVTFFMFTTPIITAFLNYILYKQTINSIFIFSCILLLIAFVVFSQKSLKK